MPAFHLHTSKEKDYEQAVSEFVQLAFAIVGDQEWAVTYNKTIRNKKGECPICAVANEITGMNFMNSEVVTAAKRIGLSIDVVCSIIDAADHYSKGATRSKLVTLLVNKS